MRVDFLADNVAHDVKPLQPFAVAASLRGYYLHDALCSVKWSKPKPKHSIPSERCPLSLLCHHDAYHFPVLKLVCLPPPSFAPLSLPLSPRVSPFRTVSHRPSSMRGRESHLLSSHPSLTLLLRWSSLSPPGKVPSTMHVRAPSVFSPFSQPIMIGNHPFFNPCAW